MMHGNFNPGWGAALNGHALTPVRLDGWQQGFIVPAGPGGTITLTFRPAATYHLALIVSLLAAAILLAIAAWSFTGAAPPGTGPVPARSGPARTGERGTRPGRRRRPRPQRPRRAWLGVLGVTALIFVAGGPVALGRSGARLPGVAAVACAPADEPRGRGCPGSPFAGDGRVGTAVRGATVRQRPVRFLRRARPGVRARRAGRRADPCGYRSRPGAGHYDRRGG